MGRRRKPAITLTPLGADFLAEGKGAELAAAAIGRPFSLVGPDMVPTVRVTGAEAAQLAAGGQAVDFILPLWDEEPA